MSYLQIGHTPWPWASIQHADDALIQASPASGQQVLTTARAWLRQQQQFTLYTSGSTGSPKAIEITRPQIQRSVQQTVTFLGLKPGDRLLNPLSVSYVAGFMMVMRGLVHDMPVIQVQPARQPIPDWLLSNPPAITALVPLQFKAIAEASAEHRNFFRQTGAILIGGGPLSQELEETARQTGATVYHTYGMTETLTHVAIRKVSPEPWHYFQAMPGTSFRQDEQERLIIDTPLWNKPVNTNDRVRLLDQHYFQWLGRADFVINSGGYKIQTEQVEYQIASTIAAYELSLPNFFLASVPDSALGERAILIVESSSAFLDAQQHQLDQALRAYLPRYAVPKDYYATPAFAYTHSGKLDRATTLQQLNLVQE